MDKIIFHDLIKVSEINNRILTFKDLESFTYNIINENDKGDLDLVKLKSYGFTFSENIENNIINIDTLTKIIKSKIKSYFRH